MKQTHFLIDDVRIIYRDNNNPHKILWSLFDMHGSLLEGEPKKYDHTHMLAITKDNEVIEELYLGKDRSFLYREIIPNTQETNKNYFIEKAYIIYSIWGCAFHHFVMELLPNIYYYKQNLLPLEYKIIVPPCNNVIAESLKLYDIPQEAIIYLESDATYNIKEASYSTPLSDISTFTSQINAFKELRCKVIENISNTTNSDINERLYITRHDASSGLWNNDGGGSTRLIDNEQDIIDYLILNKYDVCSVGSKTFIEKAELLQNTKIVISPYGGNIFNCIFAKNLKIIIMLVPEDTNGGVNMMHDRMIKRIIPEIEICHIIGKNTSNNLEPGRNSYLINIEDIKSHLKIRI